MTNKIKYYYCWVIFWICFVLIVTISIVVGMIGLAGLFLEDLQRWSQKCINDD